MSTKVIKIKDVGFHYPKMDTDVLNNISISVQKGEVVGLLGRNGAGKTTLVKLISGLYEPVIGELQILGQTPSKSADVRHQLGIMHQQAGFDQMLSGWENLFIAGKFYGINHAEVKDRINSLEKYFGTFPYLHRSVMSYSGGEIRRLQIFRALLHDPTILLLDEPTVGLDVEGRRDFYSVLKDLITSLGITVLWTSHYLEEIERNCDRVIVIDKGSIVADGPIQLLKEQSYAQFIAIEFSPDIFKSLSDSYLRGFGLEKSSNRKVLYKGEEKDFYSETLPALLEVGHTPLGITKVTPSLEDIFIELVMEADSKTTSKGQ